MKRFYTLLIVLIALLIGLYFVPNAYGSGYIFSKTTTIRDDGRIASRCIWEYADQKITYNVKLGLCFEDRMIIGDSGWRYPDGSAPYEYLEFVGMRNSDRSIKEWRDKAVAERRAVWEIRQEELKAMRVDREVEKLEKEISSIRLELEKLLLKLNNK
jgi:hypothetical protein